MVSDWWDVSFWVGIRVGGSLGAVIIGCVVYGFQYGLGVRGLWVSMFDVFWVLFLIKPTDGRWGLIRRLKG